MGNKVRDEGMEVNGSSSNKQSCRPGQRVQQPSPALPSFNPTIRTTGKHPCQHTHTNTRTQTHAHTDRWKTALRVPSRSIYSPGGEARLPGRDLRGIPEKSLLSYLFHVDPLTFAHPPAYERKQLFSPFHTTFLRQIGNTISFHMWLE